MGGVSWYEAAAYAEFAGKSLPTVYHWYMVAEPTAGLYLIPLSNFGTAGPAPVGKYRGVTAAGVYDMAGNVKEWCLNETRQGFRFSLGGGWNESSYLFTDADARRPFDRNANNGFRCVRYTSPLAAELTAPKQWAFRDFGKEKPAPDSAFNIYKRLFTYDRTALKPKVESVEDSEFWRKEKITFDAAYGNERVPAYLFLPKNAAPPYQTVIFFPGANVRRAASSRQIGEHVTTGFRNQERPSGSLPDLPGHIRAPAPGGHHAVRPATARPGDPVVEGSGPLYRLSGNPH